MKKIWSTETQNDTGLPRPIAHYNEKFKEKNGKIYLYSESPIPFQTSALPNEETPIGLIQENEERIYKEGLCGYCGVSFNKNDKVIRWTKDEKILNEKIPSKVPSDYHPFHLKCMKQARIYCPHMRETLDEEFEIGTYAKLKKNFNQIYKGQTCQIQETQLLRGQNGQ